MTFGHLHMGHYHYLNVEKLVLPIGATNLKRKNNLSNICQYELFFLYLYKISRNGDDNGQLPRSYD